MLSPSDFNNAVPQFTNGDYASNPINPQYIAEPSSTEYNRGAEPLQTLPAQWWNWFLNKITARFNKVNIYVKNIFNELTQLLSLVSVTPNGTEGSPTVGQLKDMFENKYPSYLALLMYPVGSIYWTGKAPDDGGDPNELFGGTWVQIKNRFIWAKGDNDALNATGGEKTHTLTVSEIPSHNHSFTPAGSISVTTNPTFTGSSVTSGANNRGHTHNMEHKHTTGNQTANPTYSASFGVLDGASGVASPGNGTISYGVNASLSAQSFSSGKTTSIFGIATDYSSSGKRKLTISGTTSGNHTHTTNSLTNTKGTAITNTGDETQNHTHSVTAKGTISGGAYKFTGTDGTTGSKGDGKAHNNMPPYIVKYCWERTA